MTSVLDDRKVAKALWVEVAATDDHLTSVLRRLTRLHAIRLKIEKDWNDLNFDKVASRFASYEAILQSVASRIEDINNDFDPASTMDADREDVDCWLRAKGVQSRHG